MYQTRIAALLDFVAAAQRKQSNHYALLISFAQVAASDRIEAILSEFHRRGGATARKFGGELVAVSETDFAILTELREYQLLGIVPELKMLLLRLIRSHLPDSFGVLDQSKLVRIFNVVRDAAALRRALERHLRSAAGKPERRALRRLTEEDVTRTVAALRDGGPQHFVQHYMRSQPIVVAVGTYAPQPALREHFVSMDAIRRDVLPDVNLLVDRNRFNVLTVELDKLVLDAIQRSCIDLRFATFNLNVETVFTRTFEAVAESGRLKGLVLEFRATDILENLDKFVLAHEAIAALGGRVTVDGLLPRMLHILRPENFGCDFVKLFFDPDAGVDDPAVAEGVTAVAAKGGRTIFARVEDEEQMRAGQRLGVELFQGFYVESLLRDQAAREKFLVA